MINERPAEPAAAQRRRRARSVRVAVALVGVAACITACSPSPTVAVPTTTDTDASSLVPTTSPTAAVPTQSTPTPVPTAYAATVAAVTAERLGPTWREECPVGAADLRLVTLVHRTFDGGSATGEIIVNASIADAVVAAFGDLYAAGFPIRSIRTIDEFGAGEDADRRSSAADNTSGFNCRRVLGTDRWSQHAAGLAIDVNPVENPYVVPGEILPPAGAAYLDRTDVRTGMIIEGDATFDAFTSRGFEWGGFFVDTPDYQHFAVPR